MKKILLLLTIIFLLGNISCIRERRCERHTQCPTAPLITEYFGNYKPGNYWIYENQDGTKRDSIYVTDYLTDEVKSFESETKEQSDCIRYNNLEFYLNAQYFGKQKMWARISNNNCNESSFSLTDSIYHSQPVLLFTAKQTDDTFDKTFQKINFTTITNSTVIYPKGFGSSYIADYPYYLFASKIGIIQFISQNSKDTFSLIKYKIQ
jgi:hypothetical protein